MSENIAKLDLSEVINPDARWPLLRMLKGEGELDLTNEEATHTAALTDVEMIALRIILRSACQFLDLDKDREKAMRALHVALESAREKIEFSLDWEFQEGRFAPTEATEYEEELSEDDRKALDKIDIKDIIRKATQGGVGDQPS